MNLARVMHISGGVTAVIGSGGKTTLLSALAGNLSGTVILTTSTHILPFPNLPLASNEAQVKALIGANHIVCVGAPVANGKLAEPAAPTTFPSRRTQSGNPWSPPAPTRPSWWWAPPDLASP